MTTNAPSTSTSLTSLKPSGGPTQPLVPVAALPSIQTELECSPQTVHALVAVILGLMRETLSPDSFSLALRRSKTIALQMGVTEEEMARVHEILLSHYQVERRRNPLHSMF